MNNWVKTIFRHDTQAGGVWYSCAVAGKDQDGQTIYEYWPCYFPDGTELPDRARVEFKDFYIGFYIKHDGTPQHKFVVQDFLVGQGQQSVQQGYGQYRAPQGYQRPSRSQGYPQQGYQQNTAGNYVPQQRQARQPEPQPDSFEYINEDVPF